MRKGQVVICDGPGDEPADTVYLSSVEARFIVERVIRDTHLRMETDRAALIVAALIRGAA